MQYLWNCEIEDILEAQELARSRGVKAGESYEKEFLEVMAKKGKTHSGATELNKEETITEYLSHGKKIASIDIDSQGHESVRFIKPITKKDEESGLNFD
jgi:hypothetical protein